MVALVFEIEYSVYLYNNESGGWDWRGTFALGITKGDVTFGVQFIFSLNEWKILVSGSQRNGMA